MQLRPVPSAALLGLLGLIVLWPMIALGHGGGLDGYGCHYDRKRGGYHCHRGAMAGSEFSSQSDMLAALEVLQPKKKILPYGEAVPRRLPKDKEETCIRDRQSGEIRCGENLIR